MIVFVFKHMCFDKCICVCVLFSSHLFSWSCSSAYDKSCLQACFANGFREVKNAAVLNIS